MNTYPAEETYLIRPILYERGWTDATIRKFLVSPDATKPNPHYRSAAPMRLYLRQRVEEVESTPEWSEERGRTQHRQAIAAKATATKKANLLAQLDALEVIVPYFEMDILMKYACAHYNARKQERLMYEDYRNDWDYSLATPQSSPEFLARITVNYLRHCLTSYEEELASIAGKVGVKEGYKEINRRVYAAIEAAYPSLAEECSRQLIAKFGD